MKDTRRTTEQTADMRTQKRALGTRYSINENSKWDKPVCLKSNAKTYTGYAARKRDMELPQEVLTLEPRDVALTQPGRQMKAPRRLVKMFWKETQEDPMSVLEERKQGRTAIVAEELRVPPAA